MTPSAMRLIPSLLAAAALAASLAGCGSARLDKDALADRPLTPTDQYPLKAVAEGGLWTRMVDSVKLWF